MIIINESERYSLLKRILLIKVANWVNKKNIFLFKTTLLYKETVYTVLIYSIGNLNR